MKFYVWCKSCGWSEITASKIEFCSHCGGTEIANRQSTKDESPLLDAT